MSGDDRESLGLQPVSWDRPSVLSGPQRARLFQLFQEGGYGHLVLQRLVQRQGVVIELDSRLEVFGLFRIVVRNKNLLVKRLHQPVFGFQHSLLLQGVGIQPVVVEVTLGIVPGFGFVLTFHRRVLGLEVGIIGKVTMHPFSAFQPLRFTPFPSP